MHIVVKVGFGRWGNPQLLCRCNWGKMTDRGTTYWALW